MRKSDGTTFKEKEENKFGSGTGEEGEHPLQN